MSKAVMDQDTGEMLVEPDFVKLYIKEICSIRGLNTSQTKIFNFMLSNMNWDNVVSYGPTTKQSFMHENDMKNQTFNNNVAQLIVSGLVERLGRAEFRVNKKYAVKVDWVKVQSISWLSKYSEDGKLETVLITEKEEELTVDPVEPVQPPSKPKPAPKTIMKRVKPTASPDVQEVFGYWVEIMGKSEKRTKLTQERKSCIENRISEGYDVEQIKQAIEGCAKSAHHMGQNDTGTVYDDLTLICRSGSKIEQFAQNIAKVTPIRRDGVETIDDFKRKSEEQCARIRASGFLDDIL